MVSQGQFTGEYAVKAALHNGIEFSLFASEEDVSFRGAPTGDEHVEGRIRVQSLSSKDDLLLVSLPQPTFENGRTVTVRDNQVHRESYE